MKRMLIGIVAMGAVLTGCGESVDANVAGTTASLVQYVQKKDSTVTEKQATCWADKVIALVGWEKAVTLTDTSIKTPAADLQVAMDAAEKLCIKM